MESQTPELPPPDHYQYLFTAYEGDVWRDSAFPWNGQKPKASRALFTEDTLRTAIAAAVLAEREACAQVCDALETGDHLGVWLFYDATDKCAAAIRARADGGEGA